MNLRPFHPSVRGQHSRLGFTLVELAITTFAAAILFGAVVALGVYTSKNFYMVGNYVNMDTASRNTIDLMSKEIRNASGLVATGPSYLLFTNVSNHTSTKMAYDAAARTVSITKAGQTRVYLTGCDKWSYSLYSRVPNITATNITFYSTSDLNQVQLVNLTWTCSRSVIGSKLNTEIVLTAQVVLRNKVQ